MPHSPNQQVTHPSKPASGQVLTALVLFLLPFLYFYPALTGEISLMPGEGWFQNYPLRVLAGKMIAGAEFPMWNPYLFGGAPLLAAVYPGALYPPNWLFAFLPPGMAINLAVITTFHIALSGVYFYSRKLHLDRAPALIAGMIFSFGAFMIVHVGHTSRIAAAAWMPWVLWAIEDLAVQVGPRGITLGAIIIALQVLAGEPQMSVYTVLVAAGYGLFRLCMHNLSGRRIKFLAANMMMGGCGVLLSAPLLLPALELLQQGERASLSYEDFASYSLPPKQLVSFLFPYFFGGAARPPYPYDYWGAWNPGITCGYVGMAAILLALVSLLHSRRNLLVWFWGITAIVALFLSFGDYLPLDINHLLYRLPGYNKFRGPYRSQVIYTFSVAVLAGWGLHAWINASREKAKHLLRCANALLAFPVIITALAYLFFHHSFQFPNLQLTGNVTPKPQQIFSLFDPSAVYPLFFFFLTSALFWLWALFGKATKGAAHPTFQGMICLGLFFPVLLLDLVSYGHFSFW